jgi:hypothetical protein
MLCYAQQVCERSGSCMRACSGVACNTAAGSALGQSSCVREVGSAAGTGVERGVQEASVIVLQPLCVHVVACASVLMSQLQ